ncbi:MAG: sigma 54-interacting transcriptional regulator [Deferribacteraceae bacterium]|jgi:two-component system nitrogen regulation response regulator GlnG|nr:sigma 54-interacting transcriptional regulator [Deferribacteraceae bacterium]
MTSIKTTNEKMKGALAQMANASSNDVSVAIFGAKGVGKSYCARLIHDKSNRGGKPFVTIKSGANVRQFFETAGTGSLFFANFNTYSETQQGEILECINLTPPICRLITSSSESLEKISKRYPFSEVLCHKLSVIQIKIPSLRERKDDFPLLVNEISAEIANWLHKENFFFTPKAIEKLSLRNWPENIAELKCILFYILSNARSDEITDNDIPTVHSLHKNSSLNEELYRLASELIALAKDRQIYNVAAEYEKLIFPPLLEAALSAAQNKKSRAAELLGINRNTLRTKLSNLGK